MGCVRERSDVLVAVNEQTHLATAIGGHRGDASGDACDAIVAPMQRLQKGQH